MWVKFHRGEQKVAGYEMENLLRNTDSTSITTMFPDSGPTYFSPRGTSRSLDHWVGLVGIDHIVEECGVLWQTRRRLQLIPPANSVDFEIHSAASNRRRQHGWGLGGDLQAIADCLQKGDKRVEFLQAVDSSLEKAKSRFDMLREDPTLDAHFALWVDCMRETAETFFSLHRTSKRNDAQKKLFICDSNWFLNKQSAENRW